MALACPKCGGRIRIAGTWSFPSYVARNCLCTICGDRFETHETTTLEGNRLMQHMEMDVPGAEYLPEYYGVKPQEEP